MEEEIRTPGPRVEQGKLKIFFRGVTKGFHLNEIAYVNLLENFTVIRTIDNEVYVTVRTKWTSRVLGTMMKKNDNFLKINPSFLTRIEFIKGWDDKIAIISMNGSYTVSVQRDTRPGPEREFNRKLRTV